MTTALLSAHDVVRTVGTHTVLDRVSLAVDDGARIALIGRNGSGKSTLLRILAGAESPDAGRVVTAAGRSVLHLPQLDGTDERRPVRLALHERLGIAEAERRLDGLAAEMAAGRPELAGEHALALEEWLALGGADVDPRLDRAAAQAGLAPELLDRPTAELSGGQQARAMLAAITVARADVLLLDEPANHLDADGLELLRSLLLARAGGVIIVAHDRALLGAVTNRVIELDPHTGTATAYAGGWAAYEQERRQARRQAEEAHERARAERDRLTELARVKRTRAVQGVHNASSENDRSLRHLYEQTAQRVSGGLAGQLDRRAARLEVPDRPWQERAARLAYVAPPVGDRVLVSMRGAVLRRGSFTVGPLDLEVRDGERLLLAGPNGCGKSTMIAALAGRLAPERGSVSATGLAEVAQQRSRFGDDGRPLIATVQETFGLEVRAARAALAAMGLDADHVARPARALSPGERTRAELAAIAASGARLLVLDEPTNHLDTDALEALEAALHDWPGALIVATHDQRLREGLGLERVLRVEGRAGA